MKYTKEEIIKRYCIIECSVINCENKQYCTSFHSVLKLFKELDLIKKSAFEIARDYKNDVLEYEGIEPAIIEDLWDLFKKAYEEK